MFGIHIPFPSLNICLTYSPVGPGCAERAWQGQAMPWCLSAPPQLWLVSGSSFSSAHSSSCFPFCLTMFSGRNQCKLETKQGKQICSLDTGSWRYYGKDRPSKQRLASNYCLPCLPGVVQSLRWKHLATLSAEDKSLGDSKLLGHLRKVIIRVTDR